MSHETIRLRLEKMLPPLEHLASLEVLTQSAIRDIMEARTTFEYKMCCSVPLYRDFVDCIAYEKDLLEQIRTKTASLGVKIHHKWMWQINSRVHHLYERFLERFGRKDRKQQEAIVVEYSQYLAKTRCTEKMNIVLSRALESDPTNENFWMLLVQQNTKRVKDIEKWRALLTRAARMCPLRAEIYHKRVSIEVAHVAKGIEVISALTDQSDKKDGVERLIPFEEVPLCILSAYISRLSPEKVRSECVEILRPFVRNSWAPYGRDMIEYLSVCLAQRCGVHDVADTAQVTPLRFDQIRPTDDSHKVYIASIQQEMNASILEWETENNCPMQNISGYVLNSSTVDEAVDDFEVVADEGNDEAQANESVEASQFKGHWETLYRKIKQSNRIEPMSESQRFIVAEFESFIRAFVAIQRKEAVIPMLSEIDYDSITTSHSLTERESPAETLPSATQVGSISTYPFDVNVEVLESFLHAFSELHDRVPASSVLSRILRALRRHGSLLTCPANLSIILEYASGGVVSLTALFPEVCQGSDDPEEALAQCALFAWEEVTNERFEATHPKHFCLLSCYVKRWHVLKQLAGRERLFPSKQTNDTDRDDQMNITKQTLIEKAYHRALHDALDCRRLAERENISVLRDVTAEANTCVAHCIRGLHRVGVTSSDILSHYSAHTHLFASSAWKSLALHETLSHVSANRRRWVYTNWLRQAKDESREALIEAYAACILNRSGLSPKEIERIRDEAYRTLRIEETKLLVVPPCYA